MASSRLQTYINKARKTGQKILNQAADRRAEKTLAQGTAANKKRNDTVADNSDVVITNPRDEWTPVTLADSKPTVMIDPNKPVEPNPLVLDNPGDLRNSPEGRVNPNSINAQQQFDANLAAKRQAERLPDPKPPVPEVYEIQPGATPALERGLNRAEAAVATATNPVTVDGQVYTSRAAYEASRVQAELTDIAERIKQNIPVAKAEYDKLSAAVKSGEFATQVGGAIGTQAKSLGTGAANSVPYVEPNAYVEQQQKLAEEYARLEAMANDESLSPAQREEARLQLDDNLNKPAGGDVDPNAPKMNEIDGRILPTFDQKQAVTLGNGSSRDVEAPDLDAQINEGFGEPNAPPPRTDAEINAEIDRQLAIAGNKDIPKANRNAAAAEAARLQGTETGDRTWLGKTVDTLNPANWMNKTPDSGEPKPPKGPGKTYKAFRAGGAGLGLLEAGDLIGEYVNNRADYGEEEADRIAIEGVTGAIDEAGAGLRRQGTRIDQGKYGEAAKAAGNFALDSLKGTAQVPGNFRDQVARLSYNFWDQPESGITFPKDTPRMTSEEALAGYDERSAAELKAFDNAQAGDVAETAREEAGQDSSNKNENKAGNNGTAPTSDARTTSYVPPGLKQDRRGISDEQYQVNNFRVNDIQADQEPGTGFMQSQGPDGNFETFIDGRGQPEPRAQQERGLGAARNEIDGRGRYANGNRYSDSPDANFLAELAGGRMRATNRTLTDSENRTQAANEKNAIDLRGQIIDKNTAARQAQSEEASEIWKMLGNPDTKELGEDRALSQLTSNLNTGNMDPGNKVNQIASEIIANKVLEQLDTNVFKATWNSLMPAFLGGGGMGMMQFFNGEEILDTPTNDVGDIILRSSEPTVDGINVGEAFPTKIQSLLRQRLNDTKTNPLNRKKEE
jgi:hypothetical protein